ncbi:MAG: hypothetical protein JXJ18_09255 [Rhodobacteraceae bacterium]|nr:hypothetical protein [Paracoccaceae bacterium]
MSTFATEFPVDPGVGKAEFVAAVSAWIKGIRSAELFSDASILESKRGEAILLGDGEELLLREVNLSGGFANAARYDICDDEGRLWRTEVVHTKKGKFAAVRVRGQCIARSGNPIIRTPKKPHIIRQFLESGWGAADGDLPVSEDPYYLEENSVDFAAKILSGDTYNRLPSLYLSRTDSGDCLLDADRLAKILSGVAHVIVEPSRAFSFQLMEACKRKNPYGGTTGFCVPGYGVVRRFFLTPSLHDPRQLTAEIVSFVSAFSANRAPVLSLEWQEVQELFLRAIREGKDEQTLELVEELFKDELAAKDETIANLRQQLEDAQSVAISSLSAGDGLLPADFVARLGQELYPGEFSDRLRLALSRFKDLMGLDDRTAALISRIYEESESSGRIAGLVSELKAAGRDAKKSSQNVTSILKRLGYDVSSDGKHIKATPAEHMFGIGIVTLPKTPSDHRAGKNMVRDISSALNLNDLK